MTNEICERLDKEAIVQKEAEQQIVEDAFTLAEKGGAYLARRILLKIIELFFEKEKEAQTDTSHN